MKLKCLYGIVGPSLSVVPTEQWVIVGHDATFTWRVDGNPDPTVIWQKGGERLANGDTHTVTSQRGGALTVYNTSPSHTANYTFIATNNVTDMGRHVILEARQSVSLLVAGRLYDQPAVFQQLKKWFVSFSVSFLVPPSVSVQSPRMVVAEGNDTVMLCTSNGIPIPAVRWIRDNHPVTVDSPASSALNLKSVEIEDGGLYVCVASNLAGNSTTTLDLVVHCTCRLFYCNCVVESDLCCCHAVAPRLSSNMRDERVLVGGNVSWSCSASANPSALISWKKDGLNLVSGRLVKLSENETRLSVRGVQTHHSGVYRCEANNYLGIAHVSTSLFVIGTVVANPFIT